MTTAENNNDKAFWKEIQYARDGKFGGDRRKDQKNPTQQETHYGFSMPQKKFNQHQKRMEEFKDSLKPSDQIMTLGNPCVLEKKLFERICQKLNIHLFPGIAEDGDVGFSLQNIVKDRFMKYVLKLNQNDLGLFYRSLWAIATIIAAFFVPDIHAAIMEDGTPLILSVILILLFLTAGTFIAAGAAYVVIALIYGTAQAVFGLSEANLVDKIFYPADYLKALIKQKGLECLETNFTKEFASRNREAVLKVFWPDNVAKAPTSNDEIGTLRITLPEPPQEFLYLLEMLEEHESKRKEEGNRRRATGVFAHADSIGIKGCKDALSGDPGIFLMDHYDYEQSEFVAIIGSFGMDEHQLNEAKAVIREFDFTDHLYGSKQ